MKKVFLGILICLFVLVGCENKQEPTEKEKTNDNLTLTYEGVNVTPGATFSSANIKKEAKVSTIPSCAFEGVDNVYTYNDVEITTNVNNGKEIVYSVYFLDESVKTDKGIGMSDEKTLMIEKYGNNYKLEEDTYIYEENDMLAKFKVSGEFIVEIEFLLKVN